VSDPINQRIFGAIRATTQSGTQGDGGEAQPDWSGYGLPAHPSNGRYNRRPATVALGSRIVSDQERSTIAAAPARNASAAAPAAPGQSSPPSPAPAPAPAQATEVASPPDAPLVRDEDAFRARWSSVQVGFVDDPRGAVAEAEQLVSDVIADLVEGFRVQRRQLETGGDAATDDMRMAFQRYRDFFDRLLHL
jgi:hypothetical protein